MPVKEQRETARRAAILAAKVGNDRVEALAWMSAALAAADAGDDRGVDDLLAQASAAAARSGDPELPLLIDDAHGEILIYAQKFDDAIALCQKTLDTARAAYGDKANSVDESLRCLSTAYYQTERWDDAKRVSAERLELTKKIDGENAGVTMDATRAVALATFWGGDREAGRAQLKALIAKESAISGDESLPVLETTWKLSLAESHDGSLATPEAMEASARAAELAEKLLAPDDLHRATILSGRADVLQQHGDTDASLAEYEKVLAVYDQIDNVALWAPVAYNVADGYASAGKCDHAEPLLTRLIAAADAGKANGSIGPTSHGLLGVCELADKKVDAGIVELKGAIADCDKLGAIEFAAQFRIELAKGLLEKGDRAGARKLLKEVDTTLPHDDDPVHDLLRKMAKDVHA
jgi:tetratricopeptide (TPR) repeat protein